MSQVFFYWLTEGPAWGPPFSRYRGSGSSSAPAAPRAQSTTQSATTSDGLDRCACVNCWWRRICPTRPSIDRAELVVPCFAGCGKEFHPPCPPASTYDHLSTHIGGKGKFRCPVQDCPRANKVFSRWKDFQRHNLTIHCTQAPKFPCPVLHCRRHGKGEGFTRRDKLRDHIRKVHPNGVNTTPTGTLRRIQPKPAQEGTNTQA